MSHQYPGPYTGGPAPYQPPPPPKKGMNGWAIAGITLGGIFAFLIIIGVAFGDGTPDKGNAADTAAAAPEKPAAKEADAKPAKPKPAPEAPVKVTAKKTEFAKSILADDGAYTSIQVTITNNSDETISVNPLYITITDTNGTKHTAELGVDENQIDTVKLAPGENVSGVVTGKGKFTGKYVTYTDGLFSDPVRGDVS